MINQTFTLQEAFNMRLIFENENISIKRLCEPFKNYPLINEGWHKGLPGGITSLAQYFTYEALEKATLYLDTDNRLALKIITKNYILTEKERTNIKNWLKNDACGISVNAIKDGNREIGERAKVYITISPDILVCFIGEEETPCCIMPEITAYTF